MSQLPDMNLTFGIWIGVFGKALIKKGVLTKDEVIAELTEVKDRFSDKDNPHAPGIILEINNMISTVNKL